MKTKTFKLHCIYTQNMTITKKSISVIYIILQVNENENMRKSIQREKIITII